MTTADHRIATVRRRLDTTAVVYIALAAVVVISTALMASMGRNFFSPGNLRTVLTGMSVLGFVALGQTLVVICASLDLSVPYVVSLSSLLAAVTMAGDPARIPLAVALTLGVAVAIGLTNGLVVTKLRVNGFIATLGSGLIIKGYLDTTYKGTAGRVPPAFQTLGTTGIGPIPTSTIIVVVMALVVWLILNRTRIGHHMFAVGGNAAVARLSGVRTAQPIIAAHIGSSVLSAFAGLLLASRLGVGSPTVGTQGGYDLLSIAAVVLGGTFLLGGRGSIWGTMGGVAIFAVLDSLLSVLQVNPFLKDVVRGAVIVAAVAVYSRRTVLGRRTRFAGTAP